MSDSDIFEDSTNTTNTTSTELIEEKYSLGQRWLILVIIYVISLIICIIFLFLRTDVKQFSLPIFILCLIYSSFFVLLNVIAMFDLLFSNDAGFTKLLNMIEKYYNIYDYIDKCFGFVLFNIIIKVMESGFYFWLKRIFDYFVRIGRKLTKAKNYGEIIFKLIVAGAITAILIIFKKRFGLGSNFFEYFRIILDVLTMIEIYTNVGFFMYQIISDYRRKKNINEINRYYRYSKIKIIQETEKYMNKVNISYKELKKDSKIFLKNNEPAYHQFLQKIYAEMKTKMTEYGYIVEPEEIINNITNADINNNSEAPIGPAINNNDKMPPADFKNMKDFQNIDIQELAVNRPEASENRPKGNNPKKKLEVKKDDLNTSRYIRKYKKAVRRIDKLKKLYKEIDIEYNEDLNRLNMNKKCSFGYVILFIAFSIALLSDFFLPIAFDPEDDFTKSADDKLEKFDSTWQLALAIILIYPFSVILSSYTIIMIYSNMRKKYITGDYLYDKQINDNINLMKSVNIICGYSSCILYCNIYFWRTIDTHGHYGKPKFYETTIIPDYTFKRGITVFMIVKLILIVSSMIISQIPSCFCSCNFCSYFENDLAEFNSKKNIGIYDNDNELNKFYNEKAQAVAFLNK